MENKKTRAPSSVNPAECMGSFRELTPVSSDDEDRIPSPPFEILGVDAAAAAPAAAPAANPRRSDRIRERSVSRASSRNPSRDVSPEPSVDTNRAASMEPVGRRPRRDSSAASSREASPQPEAAVRRGRATFAVVVLVQRAVLDPQSRSRAVTRRRLASSWIQIGR